MKRIHSMFIGSLLLFTSMDAHEKCQPLFKKKVNEVYGRVKHFIKKHQRKLIFCGGVITGGTLVYLFCCCGYDKKTNTAPNSSFDDVDDESQKLSCHDFHSPPRNDEGKESNDASKAGRRWYFPN